MRLLRRIQRVAGTASLAAAVGARLALRRSDGDVRAQSRLLHEVAARLLRIHGIEVEERGSRPPGAALIVSNHVNYLDPLVVMACHPALPVAKSEVRDWPVIGPLCERCGVQFVDRGRSASGASVLRMMARTLRRGASILNFPEGTTTDGAKVLPLKPASFLAARVACVPVIPAAIAWDSPRLGWTGNASFLPHYIDVAGRERIRVRLEWGEPLSATEDVHDLSRHAHRFLQSCLKEGRDAAAECA